MDRLFILNNDEQVQAVLSNRGAACPFFDAVHREQLNGENTLTFSIPADHEDARFVVEENLVLFKDPDANYQLFVIREIEDEHGDGLIKKVHCEHAATELLDFNIHDKRPENRDANYMLFEVLAGTRWEPGIVEVQGTNSAFFYDKNVYACVMEIAALFGGEVRFRVQFLGNKIIGRYVDILQQRGTNTGKRFVYGKDVKNIRRTVDTTQLATALIGRGKGVENEEGTGYGRKLDFSEVEWSKAKGDPVDKPLGQRWVGDPEALEQFGYPDGKGGKLHRTRIIDFEDEEDPVALLQKTWEALQQYKVPIVSYEMDVVDLERAAGYDHEAVRLGDTVTVIDRAFSPEIRIQARVIEIERNLTNPEESRVVLGNFVEPLRVEETIQNIKEKVFDKTVPTSWLDGIIDAIKNEIHSGGGTVRQTHEGLLITDKPPEQGPTKFIKLVDGKIMLADGLVNGEPNYRTFIDGNIVYADLIAGGTMLADRVRGGDLYLGGIVNGIGKDGRLFLLDSEDNVVAQLDAATRGFDQLTIGHLTCPNVANVLLEDVTYYVDVVDGDDENDGLTPQTAFKTIQRAIDVCPKILHAYCRIHVLDKGVADWDEFLYIYSFYGHGNLEIYFPEGGNMTLHGAVLIEDCTTRVKIYDAVVRFRDIPDLPESQRATIWILNSQMVEIFRSKWFGESGIPYVIQASNSYVHLENSEVWDARDACIMAQRGTRFDVVNVKGGRAAYGIWSSRASIVGGHGDGLPAPKGTTNNTRSTGGGVVWNGFDFSWGGSTTAPPKSQSVTKRWTSTGVGSYEPTYGWRTDYVYQGDPGSWAPALGNYRGLWFFNASSIRSALSGKTIKSIRIKLTRRSKGGYYSSRPLYFYTHNKTSASGGAPSLSNSAGKLASFKPGESKWVNLPVSFGNALKNGTATGIAIYDSSGSQSNYLIMEKGATLEITYQ